MCPCRANPRNDRKLAFGPGPESPGTLAAPAKKPSRAPNLDLHLPALKGAKASFPTPTHERSIMAKSMTQSEIVGALADATGLTKVQVRGFLEAQCKVAYKNAKNNFTIPG